MVTISKYNSFDEKQKEEYNNKYIKDMIFTTFGRFLNHDMVVKMLKFVDIAGKVDNE